MGQLLAVIAISIGVSGLCSVLEAVLLSITTPYVALLRKRGDRAGELLHRLRTHVDEPISAILTLNTIAHTIGAAVSGAIALRLFGEQWLAAFSAVLTLAILVFSEIIPKTIGARSWRSLARPSAFVLAGMVTVLKPLLIPLAWVSRLFAPTSHGDALFNRGELLMMARMGRRQGALGEEQLRWLHRALQLHDVPVSGIMTPRTELVAVPLDTDVETALRTAIEGRVSRLLVYEETLDRPVGIAYLYDLLDAEAKGVTDLTPLLEPPLLVPVTRSSASLLEAMRREEERMAVVLDEFGGTTGIVTLHDLVEEVVGEIYSRDETGEEPILALEGGGWRLAGRLALRDLEERLEVTLNEDQVETVGGYMQHSLGRPARIGDVVGIEGGRLEVIEMTGRRIDGVRLDLDREATQLPAVP